MIRFLIACLFAGTAFAQTGPVRSVTVVWNPNTEPILGGYVFFWGPAPHTYTNQITVTNPTATIPAVPVGSLFYITVSAFDTNGLQSPLADEVAFIVPSKPQKIKIP